MKKRRLFLHCGLPKTGTTAMQLWWEENSDAMRSLGLIYPDKPKLFEHKHGFLVGDLRSNSGLRRTRKMFAALSNQSENILLSNEGLSNHFHDFHTGRLADFKELSKDFDVTIILFRRDLGAWLTSYHRQSVLNPNPDGDELWGTALTQEELRSHPRVAAMLDVDTLAHAMRDSFGAVDIVILDFELPKGFQKLLGLLGLERLENLPLPWINESVPDWAVEFLRRINRSGASENARSAWKALLCDCLGSSHTVLRADLRKFADGTYARQLDTNLLKFAPEDAPIDQLRVLAQGQKIARHANN